MGKHIRRPDQYSKGSFGHVLDLRSAIGRLSEVSREWCRAFDVGDTGAVESLGSIIHETLEEIASAAAAVGGDGPV